MARACYLLNGFAGGELHYGPPLGDKVWVHAWRLKSGGLRGLRLAQNGIDPDATVGRSMVPGNPMDAYYGATFRALSAGLGPQGYETHNWGWDWRKDIREAGGELASDIRGRATPAEPAAIVAHSAGGLVARWAYLALVQTGEANLLRRIVTLGTPHFGTYAPVMMLSRSHPTIDGIFEIIDNLFVWFGPVGRIIQIQLPTKEQVCRDFATFPCMYQLFPQENEGNADEDENRDALYNVANWPSDRGLSTVHMAIARFDFWPFLNDPEFRPPPEVLTCVAGNRQTTPRRLQNRSRLGYPDAFQFSEDGDGTVLWESALIRDYPRLMIDCDHENLPSDPRILAVLPGLVTETTGPAPAPEGLRTLPGAFRKRLRPTPTPQVTQVVWVDEEGNSIPDPQLHNSGSGFFSGISPGGSMAGFHVSFLFFQKCELKFGWSENYWNDIDDKSLLLAQGNRLAGHLAGLHGTTTLLETIRFAEIGSMRRVDDSVYHVDSNPESQLTILMSDFPTTACLQLFRGSAGYKTRQWMKGIPDSCTDNGGRLKRTATEWNTRFTAYSNYLRTGGDNWRIRVLDKTVAHKPIQSIVNGVVTVPDHGYTTNDFVRIERVHGQEYANQIWRITVLPGGNTFSLNGWNPADATLPVFGKNMRVRKQVYVLQPITACEAVRTTKKNVGRPFGLGGGRRKKKKV